LSEAPFAGIATFLKAPHVAQPSRTDGDVAVLGVPFDESTCQRPGARFGPRAMRDVSTFWSYRDGAEPVYDGETDSYLLGGVRFVDAGDVELGQTWPEDRRNAAITTRVASLLDAGLMPLVLGGDHSITYAVLAAYGQRRPHLVQFDTHMDYWDQVGDMRYTHGSPIIRAHEEDLVTGVTQYGIRGFHTVRDNVVLARERGVHTYWCERARRAPVEDLVAHIPQGGPVYVTLDIDVLDPSIAPGTGTPQPGGFSYYEARAILQTVVRRGALVGMDVVEVAPAYDGPGQLTALHAVRLALDTLGAALPSVGTF
jgi:agmatinase